MFKLIVLTFLLTTSNMCFSEDINTSHGGIWQNIKNNLSYYSIQIKDDQLVLIDLSAIESSGNTLESAYTGHINGSILRRMSPITGVVSDLQLIFDSSEEGFIITVCDVCSVAPIKIHKIF